MENFFKEYLVESLNKIKISVDQIQLDIFNDYYLSILEYNKKINLTRITEPKDFIEKHLIDSLVLIKYLDHKTINQGIKVIDIGTGAGFPLLPLWIMNPNWKITLVDSSNKKLNFIREFTDLIIKKNNYLKKNNLEIIHSRSEELSNNNKYREEYDLCIARAVSNLASLSELCLSFVKIKGKFIAYKSAEVEKEIKDAKKIIKIMGGNIFNVEKFTLLNNENNRSFVFIKKESKTPKKFPRNNGTPQKKPIIN